MRPLHSNTKKRLWILCIVASLFVHLAWLVSPQLLAVIFSDLYTSKKSRLLEQSNSKSVLKLNIYSNDPARTSGISSTSKQARKNSNNTSRNYHELLPGTSTDLNFGEPGTASETPTNHKSAAAAFVQSARSSPHIREFATELRGRLAVPDKIYHLRRTGDARALMKKISDSQWKVDIFGTDSYARSMLLDAILAIPKNSVGFLKLNQSDWQRIEIGFSFEWRDKYSSPPEREESDVTIKENQINIAMVHVGSELELNKTLRRAMLILPLQGGGRMVDIVGIYKEYLKTKEPAAEFDRSIRRLEQSPAFMKSFITIPIGQ